jgi:hypothetical protein
MASLARAFSSAAIARRHLPPKSVVLVVGLRKGETKSIASGDQATVVAWHWMVPNGLERCRVRCQAESVQADLNRPSHEIVQKHILTGLPVALSSDDYFALRHEVATHFGIQPVEVVLVGSCRTGFTLRDNPEENRPRYSQIRSGSDLDVAVVSARLFDQLWDDVFDYSRRSSAFRGSPEGEEFRRMLFRGWVDPRGFPPGGRFEHADRWNRFFDGLSRDRRFGNRRTTARGRWSRPGSQSGGVSL